MDIGYLSLCFGWLRRCPSMRTSVSGWGRRAYADTPIIRLHLAGQFFRCPAAVSLRYRLQCDPTHRLICLVCQSFQWSDLLKTIYLVCETSVHGENLSIGSYWLSWGNMSRSNISLFNSYVCLWGFGEQKERCCCEEETVTTAGREETPKVPSRIETQLIQSAEEALLYEMVSTAGAANKTAKAKGS